MEKEHIITKTKLYINELTKNDHTGHDWQHVLRVYNMAVKLATFEQANLFVVSMAALLHDLDDYKLTNDLSGNLPRANEWLVKMKVENSIKERIIQVIKQVSYKGVIEELNTTDIESSIVQDADRLDAIGAIGIARTFMYGGAKEREMYNPDVPAVKYASFEEYQQNTAPVINHFYEKLLLLKNKMNTTMAKQIAEKRHKFMEIYLDQFFDEWNDKN